MVIRGNILRNTVKSIVQLLDGKEKTTMKKFVAMYAEVSDSSDNRPRALGVYDTKEDAVRAIIDDMYVWIEGMNPNDEYESEVDEDRMIANVGDNYCYWNVEEVQM